MTEAMLFDGAPTDTADDTDSEDLLALDFVPDHDPQQSVWVHEDLARVKIRVNKSHTDSVNSCSFFCDDSRILTASSDRSIKIWDFSTCKVIQDYADVHTDKISRAIITKDGSKIASAGWDRKVILKDVETGYNLMVGDHVGVVISCDISHDNRTIISGSDLDNVLNIWDIRMGEHVQQLQDIHASTIMCAVFTPDDTRIVTSSTDRTAKIYDLRTQTVTLTLQGHTNPVSRCCMSPDGHNVATASWDKSLKVWDIQTGAFRSKGPGTFIKGHDGSVSSCKFSSDNSQLVSGSYDKNIIVWDVKNEVEKLKLQGHSDWVEDVDITQNSKWILSASRDTTMRLWNLEDMDGVTMVHASTKQSIGLRIMQCKKCSKPFPLAQLESRHDDALCVFCRIQHGRPSASKLTVFD